MKQRSNGLISMALALLAASVAAYGIYIGWYGIFGNDWPYLWYYHLFGPSGPGLFAAIDRPFSGAFYAAATAALGERVWAYHLLLLVLRWGSGVLFWLAARRVWPQRRLATATAALLFTLYPGFQQQPVAVEFILHFAVLDLFLASLWASLAALEAPRKRAWVLLAVAALGTGGAFWLEYFVGLEALRPVLAWLAQRKRGLPARERLKAALWVSAPSLAVLAGFLYWRVFVFAFPTYGPVLLQGLRDAPLATLTGLAKEAAGGLAAALVKVWRLALSAPGAGWQLWAWVGLLLGGGLAAWLWLRQVGRRDTPDAGNAALELTATGALAVLLGGALFWLTGIPIEVTFPWDRSTLALMFGIALLLAGLMELVIQPAFRPVFAAALVALSLGLHLRNALEYRAEWEKMRSFAWQLAWRAPNLEPGTILFFDQVPLNRTSDNDMTALVNWIYAPEWDQTDIPYRVLDYALRVGGPHPGLAALEPGQPVETEMRGLNFAGSSDHLLVFHYNPPGCVRLLGPEDGYQPSLPDGAQAALGLSNLAQVKQDAERTPPASILGQEPERDWCWYFEKADLARQFGDWQAASQLGQEAQALGLAPADPVEWLPFLQAYVKTGLTEPARALAETLMTWDANATCAALQEDGKLYGCP